MLVVNSKQPPIYLDDMLRTLSDNNDKLLLISAQSLSHLFQYQTQRIRTSILLEVSNFPNRPTAHSYMRSGSLLQTLETLRYRLRSGGLLSAARNKNKFQETISPALLL